MSQEDAESRRNTLQWQWLCKRIKFCTNRLIEWFGVEPFGAEKVKKYWEFSQIREEIPQVSEVRHLFLAYFDHAFSQTAAELERIGTLWKETGVECVLRYLRFALQDVSDDYLAGTLLELKDVPHGSVVQATLCCRRFLSSLLLEGEDEIFIGVADTVLARFVDHEIQQKGMR